MKRKLRNPLCIAVFLIPWCFASVAGADFAGDLLIRIAKFTTLEFFRAELSVDSIDGNPIKGFTTGRIELSSEKGPLLSAESLHLKISPRSILSMKPVITAFSVSSADIDGKRLAEHIASLAPLSGDRTVTVQRADLLDSVVTFGKSRADIGLLGVSLSGKTVSADIDMKINGVPLSGTAGIHFSEGKAEVQSLAVRAGGGEILAMGTITPSLFVAALISGIDTEKISALWPGIPAETLKGMLSASFVGEGHWNTPLLSGDFLFERGSLRGIPVDKAEARWNYSGNRLALSPVKATAVSSPLSGKLSLIFSPGKIPAAEGTVSGKDLDMQAIRSLFPAAEDFGGKIDAFTVQASGPADALTGTAELSSRELTVFGLGTANIETLAEFTPASVKIAGKADIAGGKASFSGTVENYSAVPKLNLSAALRALELRKAGLHFPSLAFAGLSGTADSDITIRGTPDNLIVSGKAWSAKAAAGKEIFTSPSVSFSFRGGQGTLSSASAQWRGARLSATGKIGPAGKLDLTAAVDNMKAENIGALISGTAGFKIRGTVAGKAIIKGAAASPSISTTLSSAQITLPGSLVLKKITASASFPGGFKGLRRGDLNIVLSAAAGTWKNIPLSRISLKATKSGRTITLPSGAAQLGGGSLSGSGKAVLPARTGGETTLDLNLSFSGTDLYALTRASGISLPVNGAASGTASLRGGTSNPSFTVTASSPRASLKGITGTDISLRFSGTPKLFTISRFSAAFKGGILSGTGTVKTGRTTDVTLNISGKNFNLRALTQSMAGTGGLSIAGKAGASFKGTITGGKSRGSGLVTSPSFTVGGLSATRLNYPFTIDGDILRGKNASIAFYGGKATGSGTVNLKTMKFSHSVSFSGVDVNSAAQAFAGGLGGKVTGTAKGSLQVSGTLSPRYSLAGKGSASVSTGAVTGFRSVDIASRLYGSSGIRYARAIIPFRLETGRIILEKGTRADAPPNDPIYKFLTAQGPVGPKGALNLNCTGNINMKLFNALRSGAAGTLSGGSLENALKGLLGGIKKGMSEEDFRNASFTVRGTMKDPSVVNLKTAPAPPKKKPQAKPPAPTPVPAPVTPHPVQKPKTPEEILKEKLLESIFK